ncbi:MAG: hypothetical protein KDK37_04880 [Leptospiraceae bacterium]|nr:hypothetical protein [Leptospiraceae bacterium]
MFAGHGNAGNDRLRWLDRRPGQSHSQGSVTEVALKGTANKYWAAVIASSVLTLAVLYLLTSASVPPDIDKEHNQQIHTSRFQSVPREWRELVAQMANGPLATYPAALQMQCLTCHVLGALDGPAADGFSQGMHPVASSSLDHPFFDRSSAQCQSCHASNHAAWKESAHGRAFTNPIFQHAFQRDQKAWCLNCHAPLWEPKSMDAAEIARNPDFSALYAEGINCVTCHVRNGTIVGPDDYEGRENQLFHPVQYDPGMRSESFCARCHQFNFVAKLHPILQYEDSPAMQNTVAEFRQHFRGDGKNCVDCHYKDGSHSLRSQDKPLSDRLTLAMRTVADGGNDRPSIPADQKSNANEQIAGKPGTTKKAPVRFDWSLRMDGLGHHFPTGDLFRILSLYAYDSRGRLLYRYDFRKEVRVVDRTLISDSTLRPQDGNYVAQKSRSVFLDGSPVRCELVYRLQGSIESEISKDFSPGVLRKTIYSGPCNTPIPPLPEK